MKILPLLAVIVSLVFGGCAHPPSPGHHKPQPPAVDIHPPKPNHHNYGTLYVELNIDGLPPAVIHKLKVSVDGKWTPFNEPMKFKKSGSHHLEFSKIPLPDFVNPPAVDVPVSKGETTTVVVTYNPVETHSLTGSPGTVVQSFQANSGDPSGYVDGVWSTASHPDPAHWYSGLRQFIIHNPPPVYNTYQCGAGTPTLKFEIISGWNKPPDTRIAVYGGYTSVETITYGR